jgi:simple sugar transport system permease protein
MIKSLLKKTEFIVALVIVGLSLIIGAINPTFFSIANLFDTLRGSTVLGIFALGTMIVIISGGIDLSFTAIAIFSLYVTTKLMLYWQYEGNVILMYAIAAFIGTMIGLINAWLISSYKLPTMIATLGTSSLIRGFMLFFIDSQYIRNIPDGLDKFAKAQWFVTLVGEGPAKTSLHPAVFILVFLVFVVWFILKYTMIGRGIFAIGGSREAAERSGFNTKGITIFIYAFVGFLAGIGGMTFGAFAREANPFALVGTEMDVIAAVVLGGTLITGGRGTVIGTLLGVLLVTIMKNSLILIGIPSAWQKVVIGIILIIGTGIPAYRALKAQKQLSANLVEQS